MLLVGLRPDFEKRNLLTLEPGYVEREFEADNHGHPIIGRMETAQT